MQNHFNLSGQLALITGASSGLGVHFANVLAAEGVTVILAARREDKLASEVNSILASGGRAFSVPLDVTSEDSVAHCFNMIEREYGVIDILINNAGVADDPRKFLNTGEEDWRRPIETNLTGAWRVAAAAARHMRKNERAGSIVNIASVYGLHTGKQKVAYNVSKAGVVQLTKSMAVELCEYGIRVNALCPGWFLTPLNSDYFATESGRRYLERIPGKRLGNIEELTVPLLLLASNTAGAYMNGSMLVVDGGLLESPV